ncbi:AAA family ATPase [Azospirillum sp. A39]|uniref:AAA family ATPase n=1 Tax=Azospirillum sp. A39 TaxID=3462279 RepID=UPI004045C7CD
MRIGLTGSAGVGKTTLALTLGATLGVPVLHERMRDRLRAGYSLHALTREEHRALLREDAEDLADRAAGVPAGFVADRTPLDFVAFWLCNGYAADDPAGTADFVEQARAAVADWDLVVVLPWGVLPLVDDGVRYANPWHQLHAQSVVEGLCRRWVAADRLAFLPAAADPPEQRCAWILRQAQRRRR